MRASGAAAAWFGLLMLPLPAAKSNVHDWVVRGDGATDTVRIHCVPVPAATEYETPDTVGNATPLLKSATTTPVTPVSNVAVTLIVVSAVVVGPDDDVRVGLGGLYLCTVRRGQRSATWRHACNAVSTYVRKNPLLVPAPFLSVMEPLFSGIVTLNAVDA